MTYKVFSGTLNPAQSTAAPTRRRHTCGCRAYVD